MLRGGPQTFAQDNSKLQQLQQEQEHQLQDLKQKKRLSFRDPEVEGPQRNNNSFLGGCRSKTLARPTSTRQKVAITRKHSSSVEDLTLEDQALHIAQHVGNAFSDLSLSDGNRGNNFLESVDQETEIIDSSLPQDIPNYNPRFKISPEDEEFLDSLVPPLLDSPTMRGPPDENEDAISSQNCIPTESSFQEPRSSSSIQHQVQMLRYQLDQQNQQTQMALHQIQLLQDQMGAESAARRKAQEQNNQLMQQNTDLLNHMEKLFLQIEELEKQVQLLEQEKREKRTMSNYQPPGPSLRQPMSYAAHRRQSTEYEKFGLQNRLSCAPAKNTDQGKPELQNRTSYTAARSADQNKPTLQNRASYTAGKNPDKDKPALQNRASYTAGRNPDQDKPAVQNRASYTAGRNPDQDKPAVQNRTPIIAERNIDQGKPALQNRTPYVTRRNSDQEKPLQNRTLCTAVRSTEQDKPALQSRSSYTAARKNSLTLAKPLAMMSRPSTTQNTAPASATRKNPTILQKPYGAQNKNTDPGTKAKDTLRIGDTSPTVSGTMSPFNSVWKLKSSDSSDQSSADQNTGNTQRSRAGSLTLYGKKTQETTTGKSTLFSSGGSLSSTTGATNKKYSSSTSDLYTSPSTLQAKSSLMIEEPATGVRSAVSNLSINSTTTTASKLPRYQPYTGWQRRTSLTNDSVPISGIGKDSYKNTTSLFNK